MAIVPVSIQAISITDGYMFCERHDRRLDFQPNRKSTGPTDMSQWYRCPGLQDDLMTPNTEFFDLVAKQIKALVDDPTWGTKLAPDEREESALDQVTQDREDEDQATWFFVVELEDASVTIG